VLGLFLGQIIQRYGEDKMGKQIVVSVAHISKGKTLVATTIK